MFTRRHFMKFLPLAAAGQVLYPHRETLHFWVSQSPKFEFWFTGYDYTPLGLLVDDIFRSSPVINFLREKNRCTTPQS